MPFCTNPDCPHKIKTGSFAEYRDDVSICPECKKPLTFNVTEADGHSEKIESDFISKILITIGLLAFFRLLCFIPLPYIDLSGYDDPGSLLSFYGFTRISIVALGIMPFISAYIFVEMFSLVIPAMKRWRSQKKEGRRKLFIAARWLTLVLCIIQGFGISISLERMTGTGGSLLVSSPGWGFRFITVLTLTAGVFVLLWIADRITARGIGNGISIMIITGIAFSLFPNLYGLFKVILSGSALMETTVTTIFILFIHFLAVAIILFMERRESSIKVRMNNGSMIDLPFKYNIAGVEPAGFAASIVMLPFTITFFTSSYHDFLNLFQPATLTYSITLTIITVIFYFLFTSLYYDPDKILSFLRSKNGEPVLKEGASFEKLLDKKLTPLAIYGTIYLCLFAVLVTPAVHIYIVIGGISLIRLVSISLDIINEVKARKNGFFVKIEEFQKPYEARFVKNLLDQNNIPCFLEGYYHRSILYFFGPYVEVSLYVKKEKESEALNIVKIKPKHS
ncbi:preprotein translocase subunit SecY [Thermodesulfobacteriota bacterium]